MVKQKSLEWSHRRGLLLPTRMSTQGSLNVIQKESIVKGAQECLKP